MTGLISAYKGQAHEIYPPLGQKGPEIDVRGLLKKKKQDIVAFIGGLPAQPEVINDGPMQEQVDSLGRARTIDTLPPKLKFMAGDS